MSEPMDTREEVAFDFEKVERPYVREWGHHAIYVDDYDRLLLACKKAEATNREKDAAYIRYTKVVADQYARYEACIENLERQLASLRASVGEKWIDVKQELPPYETPVLVSVLSMPGQWRFSIVSQLWKSDIWHNVMRENYVTHWQPIVAPTLPG